MQKPLKIMNRLPTILKNILELKMKFVEVWVKFTKQQKKYWAETFRIKVRNRLNRQKPKKLI
jgi:hypothetical protein